MDEHRRWAECNNNNNDNNNKKVTFYSPAVFNQNEAKRVSVGDGGVELKLNTENWESDLQRNPMAAVTDGSVQKT